MAACGRLTCTCLASSVAGQVRKLLVLVLLLIAVHGNRVLGQEKSNTLSPVESYKAATAPFMATRSQPDDLTDADNIALSIGATQAAHDCLALSGDTSRFVDNAKELFALAQLCIFGQQFEPARAAVVSYLALPQPPQREQALLLLIRAFLGLNAPDSAAPQIHSLLDDYAYGFHSLGDRSGY
jgi:hypothetical protein